MHVVNLLLQGLYQIMQRGLRTWIISYLDTMLAVGWTDAWMKCTWRSSSEPSCSEVCCPRSWWGLRGAPWLLPPASAGRNWGSDPASAPLSACRARGAHCRLPPHTCWDQSCLPQADETLSLVSNSFTIYLVILWRECDLKTSQYISTQCCSRGTTNIRVFRVI